jgi:hypothetical protein
LHGERLTLVVPGDVAAMYSYTLDGETKSHDEPYVDLWRGETCVFTIGPDGSVTQQREFGK